MVSAKILANVVDFNSDTPLPTDAFLIDTNVLHFIGYSNNTVCKPPPNFPNYANNYATYVKRALQANARLCACALSFSELSHIIERDLHKAHPNYRNQDKKSFRFDPAERKKVLAEIQSVWGNARQMASEVLSIVVDDNALQLAEADIQSTSLDGYDLYILQAMRNANITNILTADGDYLTVPGLTVFTDNPNVLLEARQQHKLILR